LILGLAENLYLGTMHGGGGGFYGWFNFTTPYCPALTNLLYYKNCCQIKKMSTAPRKFATSNI